MFMSLLIYSSIKEGGCFTWSVYAACRSLKFLLKDLLPPVFLSIQEMVFCQHFHLCHHFVKNYRIFHVSTCYYFNEAFIVHQAYFNPEQPSTVHTFALDSYTASTKQLNLDNLDQHNTPKKSMIHLRVKPYFLFLNLIVQLTASLHHLRYQ